MRTLPIVSVVVSVGLVCVLQAAVQIPQYTQAQLQDKEYVQEQTRSLTQVREELSTKSKTASALVKMTVERDLQKIDIALEALKYVETNGYDPKDPKLAQLPYFNTSLKPAGEGFHHNMKAAGPPGGRVSYMDGKPGKSNAPKDAEPDKPRVFPLPIIR